MIKEKVTVANEKQTNYKETKEKCLVLVLNLLQTVYHWVNKGGSCTR